MTAHEKKLLWLIERSTHTWDTVAMHSREAPTVELAHGISELLRREASAIRSEIERSAQ